MKNKKAKKFESQFTENQLEGLLSGLTANQAYYFTKRDNMEKYNQIVNLLPTGYVAGNNHKMESVDFVYSGSTESQFILTIAPGRIDRYRGAEVYDVDVFNIAKESDSSNTYFLNQWHHFKNDYGNRTSYTVKPFVITNENDRKTTLYSTFLTGSTHYFSFEEYKSDKPDFYEMHIKGFGDLTSDKDDEI